MRAASTRFHFQAGEPTVARIIDANANRAREALRVIEDFVRFDLADATLSAQAKTLRHDLAEAMDDQALRLLVRARDITSDVGCTIETDSEYVRAEARDVVIAAAKRGYHREDRKTH